METILFMDNQASGQSTCDHLRFRDTHLCGDDLGRVVFSNAVRGAVAVKREQCTTVIDDVETQTQN